MDFYVTDAGIDRHGASHKITIEDAAGVVSTFWYVKAEECLPDFDKTKHMALVKLIDAKSKELRPGAFDSFNFGENDYHIRHVGKDEFVVNALK